MAITSGAKNTAIGYMAGSTQTTSAGNVYLGYEAGKVSTGAANVYIGSEAGLAAAAAEGNVVIGNNAGSSMGDIDANVLIGREAGQYLKHTDTTKNVAWSTDNGNTWNYPSVTLFTIRGNDVLYAFNRWFVSGNGIGVYWCIGWSDMLFRI